MRIYRLSVLLAGLAILGCIANPDNAPSQAAHNTPDKETPQPAPEAKRVAAGKNLQVEIQGKDRRVLVQAEVCLREGMLEQLLTRKGQKTHEAILMADIDARELHFALTLAGAEAGRVVQFRPKLAPPTGTTIKISLEYKDNGKTVRVPAQKWIRNMKSKKDFPTDWVFAGSVLVPDPLDKNKKPFYGANDGDVITVVNFEGACIDVPFLSTKDNADLEFEANTDRIPALTTPVTIVLEPVLPARK